MHKEVIAKGILTPNKDPQNWFGTKYTMNIYRGCEHQCIYCDSRSNCYQITNFADIEVKVNTIDLLHRELRTKRHKSVIGSGSMSDPYTLCEKEYGFTRKALQVISSYGFGIHINTKSDLILRDVDVLTAFHNRVSVAFTITTVEDELAKKIEPYAPLPSQRLHAIQVLAAHKIPVGILLMPVLPWIEDSEEQIRVLLEEIYLSGAKFCFPFFGMTCRQGQREYFYENLDAYFPNLKKKYVEKFSQQYTCLSPYANRLDTVFREFCTTHSIINDFETFLSAFPQKSPTQLSIFEQ